MGRGLAVVSHAIQEASSYVQRKVEEISRLDLSKPEDVAEIRRCLQRIHAVENAVGIDWGDYDPDAED